MNSKREHVEAELIDEGREVDPSSDPSVLAVISRAEIDQQIATAHRFPRSITRFRSEAMDLVTLDEDSAAECIYALPRGGKPIEGPSARLAEIVAHSWGNCRMGSRIVDVGAKTITAQGVFHDLERNVFVAIEVQRRITTKTGQRFNDDMIVVTGNAASSIAIRNAVFKVVPKAVWAPLYQAARQTVAGDVKTLKVRRDQMFDKFMLYGITPDRICAKLLVDGPDDISVNHMATLVGFFSAIKNGDTTPEESFPEESASAKGLREKLGRSPDAPANVNATTGELTDDDIPA